MIGLGIVLMPLNIRDLFYELAGITKDNIVFDKFCETTAFYFS
jgi:hypothetical protein